MPQFNEKVIFPKIMGILNITPDSFSDGGKFFDFKSAIREGISHIENGADIIDIGGESTRPGADTVTEDEEIKRVIPVIKQFKKIFPELVISIDTTKYNVAKSALDEGASIINDISALGQDIRLAKLASEYNASLIIMHIQGTPRTMQKNPFYNNVVSEIYEYLKQRIALARSFGVNSIIADIGIGFGKTLEHNLELLRNIEEFKKLDVPLCLGISRKAFIGKILGIEIPSERDIPTVLLHALLLTKNIEIIRVHNVELISMLKKIWNSQYQS
jgi:dihydropteroate synthase